MVQVEKRFSVYKRCGSKFWNFGTNASKNENEAHVTVIRFLKMVSSRRVRTACMRLKMSARRVGWADVKKAAVGGFRDVATELWAIRTAVVKTMRR